MAYKVIIPEDISEAGKEFLKDKGYEVVVLNSMDPTVLEEAGKDADALLARTAKYTREMLEKMPNLKVIGRHGVGYDNLPMDYCNEKKIWVTITPMANSNAVAEHTIMLMLACARNLLYQNAQVKAGNWNSRNAVKGEEVIGKTIGIVGCGRIGRMVAKKAAAGLDMKVVGYDPFLPADVELDYIERVNTLDELLEKSDFVSLHMPETKDTKNMVNAAFLSKMKPTASLLNCARGGIVDEDALYEALTQNKIHAAGVDVLVEEPMTLGNKLLNLDNMIVTPHHAALNKETMDRMGLDAAQGIYEVLNGQKPTWPVSRF